jgi:hypothetical protein
MMANPSSPQPSPAALTWLEREAPLRIVDTAACYTGITSPNMAADAAQIASLGFSTEHLHVMGLASGLDDQQFFFSSKVAGKKNEDYLAKYLPEAKKRGLRVVMYFDVHWYKRSFGDQHPDWVQRDESGAEMSMIYGQSSSTLCVNSPWREWCFQIVRDLCAYPIDGIFYDGPVFWPDTCYCHYCQEKFHKLYGGKLPSKKIREGPGARDLLEFQAKSLADFLHDTRTIIKAINPEIVFYMNGGGREGNWSSARLNRVLLPEQDMLGAEGGYLSGELTRIPIWKPGVTARLLEAQAPDKPRVVFSSGRPGPWNFSQYPKPELRLLYAETIANAASIFFFMFESAIQRPEIQALGEMNRFLANNAHYYRETRSEAATALVWSDTTANFYAGASAQLIESERVPQRSEVGNLDGEFSGLVDALLRSQTPLDIIDDVTLEQKGLERYRLIVLPNVACMSEKTAARLQEYVRQGGNLLATFETSLYDETGIRRNDFALGEMFGVKDAAKILGPNRWDYMQARAASPLLEGWPEGLVPAPIYHLRVKPQGGEVLVHYMQPLAGTYAGIPAPSDDPALVVNRFGRGTALYFSGDLGSSYNTYRFIQFSLLIENVLREMAPSPVVLEDAPRSVEVVLRAQQEGRRLLLHLINYTGEMARPIRRVVPLENVRVSVRTKGEVRRIHTLMRPQDLKPTQADTRRVEFVIPRLDEYEVIVLE